jgi:hypothetical protein
MLYHNTISPVPGVGEWGCMLLVEIIRFGKSDPENHRLKTWLGKISLVWESHWAENLIGWESHQWDFPEWGFPVRFSPSEILTLWDFPLCIKCCTPPALGGVWLRRSFHLSLNHSMIPMILSFSSWSYACGNDSPILKTESELTLTETLTILRFSKVKMNLCLWKLLTILRLSKLKMNLRKHLLASIFSTALALSHLILVDIIVWATELVRFLGFC